MYQALTLFSDSQWPSFLNNPETLVLVIPIVAILVGGFVAISKVLIRHRERMAMIERGMHPDHPQESRAPEQEM